MLWYTPRLPCVRTLDKAACVQRKRSFSHRSTDRAGTQIPAHFSNCHCEKWRPSATTTLPGTPWHRTPGQVCARGKCAPDVSPGEQSPIPILLNQIRSIACFQRVTVRRLVKKGLRRASSVERYDMSSYNLIIETTDVFEFDKEHQAVRLPAGFAFQGNQVYLK